MKYFKQLLVSATALALCTMSSLASASTIYLDPASSATTVGGSVLVDLVWDGTGGPDYISAFDVDITYDAAVVSYEGSVIDPAFGVDSFGCIPTFTCDDLSVVGTVDIFEFSFDSAAALMANQDFLGNTFVLATLEFKGLADGVSALVLSGTFGDAFGGAIFPVLAGGDICVDSGCAPVPEPTTLAILGLGLAGIGYSRRRRLA